MNEIANEHLRQRLRRLANIVALPGWISLAWMWFWKLVGWLGNLELVREHLIAVARFTDMLNPPGVIGAVFQIWGGLVSNTCLQRRTDKKVQAMANYHASGRGYDLDCRCDMGNRALSDIRPLQAGVQSLAAKTCKASGARGSRWNCLSRDLRTRNDPLGRTVPENSRFAN